MAHVNLGISRAINNAIHEYDRGRTLTRLEREQDKESQRREQQEQRRQNQERRQQESHTAAMELVPFQKRSLEQGIERADQQIATGKQQQTINEQTIASNRMKARSEGVSSALHYLRAGMPEMAKDLYNRYGKGRIKNLEKHPDDPDQKLWIAEGENGDRFTINPDEMLAGLGGEDEATSKNIEYVKYIADNAYGGDVKKAVELIEGSIDTRSEEQMRFELYKAISGKDQLSTPEQINAKIDAAIQYIKQEKTENDIGQLYGNTTKPLSKQELEYAAAQLNTAEGGDKAYDYIPFNEASKNEIIVQAWKNRGIDKPLSKQELEKENGKNRIGETRKIRRTMLKDRGNQDTEETLPQAVADQLKEGVITTFKNGQQWTKRNGKNVRIK